LLEILKDCRDVRLDAALQPWSPVNWDPPRLQHTYGQWVEYRLGDQDNRGRAIICYDRVQDAIYLVARTAIHDHTTLRELVAKFTPKRVLRTGAVPPST
jgi:hypothetical protein